MNTQKHDYLVVRQIASALLVMLFALLFFMPKNNLLAGSCDDLDSYEIPTLVSATATDEGIELVWEPVSDSRFLQYRVVASKTDSTPEGDVNGYLVKLTNKDASGYTIDGSVAYTNGDFFSFAANTNYYFAIAVEYNCGYITESAPLLVTFPDLTPTELVKPNVFATWGTKGIALSWDAIDHPYIEQIYVTASKLDPSPSYPDNGYVASLTATQTGYVIDNSFEYTGSDVKQFQKNTWYYVAVTAKYTVNGKAYYSTSEPARVMYEGPSADPITIQSPDVTKAMATESGFELVWTPIDDSRLTEYMIMISKSGAPAYPRTGYAAVLPPTTYSYTISNTSDFTHTDFAYLEYGESYQFAVVAVYGTDARMSTSFSHTYNGDLPSAIDEKITLAIEPKNGRYSVNWLPVYDRRLAGIYLLFSDTVEKPVYDDTAHTLVITNANGETVPGISTTSFSSESAPLTLVNGETYFTRLVFILRDGTIFYSSPTSFIHNTTALSESVHESDQEVSNANQPVIAGVDDPVVLREKQLQANLDTRLINRLRGYIMLQVEEHGEAWYIEPESGQKFYLRDAATAFAALRGFGLGIREADIVKIPVGVESRFGGVDSDGDGLSDRLEEGIGSDGAVADTDGDGFSDSEELKNGYNPLGQGNMPVDTNLVNRLRGRIILQVEKNGQAWYVNPQDGKRYYMQDGEAAFSILRFLSLGATNTDLRKIGVGVLEVK